jgi:mannosylglucosylglycerate synthase
LIVSDVVIVSYRLGMADGVSIEASKWRWALQQLGHDVRTVAGEGTADVLIDGLAIGSSAPPDRDALERALSDAEWVIVENICSLPINPAASALVAEVLKGRRAVLHHHDLPWQRQRFTQVTEVPDDPRWRHVTINELSATDLRSRGVDAVEIPNHFDFDPPAGDRDAMREAIGVRRSAMLVVHPTRAIPRKNCGAALRLAERLGAVYWLVGGAEDGYGPQLDELLNHARTGVRHGMPEGRTMSDVYAAADVVVLSSSWEGFGNAAIESIAHRRPLARSRYPVMAEIERNGLQFFDLNALEALEKFVDRPNDELLDENLAIARRTYELALLPARLEAVLKTPS